MKYRDKENRRKLNKIQRKNIKDGKKSKQLNKESLK